MDEEIRVALWNVRLCIKRIRAKNQAQISQRLFQIQQTIFKISLEFFLTVIDQNCFDAVL